MVSTSQSKCARCGKPMDACDASQGATHPWCRKVPNGDVRSLYDDQLKRGGVRHYEVELFPETQKVAK